MKIKILGTGAAEGVPAPFCKCRFCEYSRKHLDKELRKRSSVLVDDILLVDFGPDILWNSLAHKVEYCNIKYIIFSHSHFDHFCISSLLLASKKYRENKISVPIVLVGSEQLFQKLQNLMHVMEINGDDFWSNYKFIIGRQGDKILLGNYTVEVISSTHSKTEECFLYLIEDKKNTFFYSTDTTIYNVEEIFGQYKGSIDLILSDCTYGIHSQNAFRNRHMGVNDNFEIWKEMYNRGLLKDTSKYILTHFSHDSMIPHRSMCDYTKKKNMEVAYDGMEIELE